MSPCKRPHVKLQLSSCHSHEANTSRSVVMLLFFSSLRNNLTTQQETHTF